KAKRVGIIGADELPAWLEIGVDLPGHGPRHPRRKPNPEILRDLPLGSTARPNQPDSLFLKLLRKPSLLLHGGSSCVIGTSLLSRSRSNQSSLVGTASVVSADRLPSRTAVDFSEVGDVGEVARTDSYVS